jgi:hypothetical protein
MVVAMYEVSEGENGAARPPYLGIKRLLYILEQQRAEDVEIYVGAVQRVHISQVHTKFVLECECVTFPGIIKRRKYEGWVAKSVARQLATAVLWVRIQTSLLNHNWATKKEEMITKMITLNNNIK